MIVSEFMVDLVTATESNLTWAAFSRFSSLPPHALSEEACSALP